MLITGAQVAAHAGAAPTTPAPTSPAPTSPAPTSPAPSPPSPAPSGSASITGKLLLASSAPPRHGVVYLEGVPAGAWSLPRETVVLSQRDARFWPEFMVVTAGQSVAMPNDDRITHNVFSLSPAKKFDLGHYAQGESRTVRFERPGIVEIFCNIHESMQAVIVVAPSTFFAQTGEGGSFTLHGVPPGRYKLVGYSPDGGQISAPVEVKAGEHQTLNLGLRSGPAR